MSDTTTESVPHVYCMNTPTQDNSQLLAELINAKSGKDTSPMAMAALMNNGGMNGWMNNPFVYLVWMMMMRYMGGNGWGDGTSAGENTNSRAIATLQDTVTQQNLNSTVLDALSNNQNAIRELAQTFNADISSVQQACCNINAAIASVGGQIGYSAERVINAVNLGDQNITSKLCECCCNTQKAIMQQGYENQLATERQTNQLGSQISGFQSANQLGQFQMQSALGNQVNDVRNALVNGFSQVGYETQKQTCDIINSQNAGTQRIIDTLNNHWTAELSQELQTAKFEQSQLKQNVYLGGLINGGSSATGSIW